MRDMWVKGLVVVVGVMLMGRVGLGDGIVVTGSGVAKGRPTQVEIECTLSGDAELAADATVKFRDAKKQALAAIAALKNSNLSVESMGISVNSALDQQTQMMMMQGRGAGTGGKPRVQILEKSRIVLTGADKLEPEALLDTVLKVLDVAKDAGFQVGNPPTGNYYEQQMRSFMGNAVVAFKLPDGKKLREEAYKSAIAEAREKAEKLAELSGVKLGKVVSVQESATKTEGTGSGNQMMMYYAMEMLGRSMPPEEKGVTGTNTGELTTRVNLTVQFEIAK